MTRIRILSHALPLFLLGGCYSITSPALRSNFPGETHLQVTCKEYSHRNADQIAEYIGDLYKQGWRLAYVSEALYGFIFYSPTVQLCFEKPAADSPSAQGSPASGVQLGRDSMGGQSVAGVAASEQARTPPDEVEEALRAYDRQDYATAVTNLELVVARKTRADEQKVLGAQFFLGKAYFKSKRYPEALAAFAQIANKGRSHPYFDRTLTWLVSLSHQLSNTAEALTAIGKYERQDLEQSGLEPVRDELYYLLGQSRMNQGDPQQALDLLGRVHPGTPYYEAARKLMAQTSARKP